MKLQKRREEDQRKKSPRPSETKHISLERIARGIVIASSAVIFQVELSKKRYYTFERDNASEYNQPRVKTAIRCIYHGDKNNLLPYTVYDLNWNIIWKEK